MLKEVTRTYSRSINTKNFGVPESWIKIEATYTAECESGDDPIKISKMIYDQAKSDVLSNIKEITDAIKASRTEAHGPDTPPASAPVTPAPVETVQTAPVQPAPVVPPFTPPAPAPVNTYTQPVAAAPAGEFDGVGSPAPVSNFNAAPRQL